MKVYAIVEGAYYDSEVKYIVTDKALAEKLEKEVFEKDLIATHIEEHDTDNYKKEYSQKEKNMKYKECSKWGIDDVLDRGNRVLMTDLFSESVHDIEELTYIEVKEAMSDESGRYVFFEAYEDKEAEND